MKFSLLIPVAIHAMDTRRAEMLVECLDNIRSQTHQDYEVILKDAFLKEPVTLHKNVNDAIGRLWPHVNYFAMPDKNITDGLNQALWWATGDIIHWLGGDDTLGASDTLSFVDNAFSIRDANEPLWMYGSTGCLNADSTEGPWGITPFATLSEILIHNRMGAPATYWNRTMFKKLGYFEYTLAMDYDYWCRCYRTAPPMYTTRIIGVGRRWDEAASYINSNMVEIEARAISHKHTTAHAQGQAPIYIPYNS